MVSDTTKHYPVLLNELISIITPQHGGTFIDCTFGQGGYTKEILRYKNTNVIALDRDIESKKKADQIFNKFQERFIFKNKKFSQLNDLKLKIYQMSMKRKLFNIDKKPPFSLIGVEKRAALAIQNHFRLSNYQMLVLSWIKGLWTGILLSLVVHYFISH